MGTFIYCWYVSAKIVDTPYDTAIACLLVALELPAYLNVWRLWMRTRR